MTASRETIHPQAIMTSPERAPDMLLPSDAALEEIALINLERAAEEERAAETYIRLAYVDPGQNAGRQAWKERAEALKDERDEMERLENTCATLAHERWEEIRRLREERDRLEEDLWRIIDRHGPRSVPSDIRDAVNRLCMRADAAESRPRARENGHE